jgi:hypothetical protein
VDIFATYAVDEDKELNGAEVSIGDAKFTIARAGNKNYVKLLQKEVEKNQKALDAKDDSADKLSDRIMIDVIAETVLLGWEGVTYKGQPFEYSKTNARELLSHKEFRREIMKRSDDFSSFQATFEGEVKN